MINDVLTYFVRSTYKIALFFYEKNVLGKITGIKTIESKLKALYHTVVGQFHHCFHLYIHIEIIQDSNPVFKVHVYDSVVYH